MIPRFYTILSDRQRENEVKALCQYIVWVLTDNGLSLYFKLLTPIGHRSLLVLSKSKK